MSTNERLQLLDYDVSTMLRLIEAVRDLTHNKADTEGWPARWEELCKALVSIELRGAA